MGAHERPHALNVLREPAVILIGVIGPAATLVISLVHIDPTLASALNAVAVAVAGVLTAFFVRTDQLVPALSGMAQAVLTLALAFGLHLAPEQQAGVLVIAGMIVAAFVRTQVAAPVPTVGRGAPALMNAEVPA